MNLSYSPEEEQFSAALRAWLAVNLPDGWLAGNRSLPTDLAGRDQFLRQWQRRLYAGGWAGISWPKEFGGRGASLVEEVIYEYEMVRAQAPPQLNLVGIQLVGPTLIEIGTAAQKAEYLNKIISGDEIWCQGFSEPNAGSDLASLQTKAVKDGSRYIINGQKIWTSYAHAADRCFLLARTSVTEKKHFGITAFLIDMHQPGIEVRPIHQINGDSDFNEVFFTNAIAERDDIVGQLDQGWGAALVMLKYERGLASQIFELERTLSDILRFAKTHSVNGRALIDDEVFGDRIADLYVRALAARLTFYRHVTEQARTGSRGAEGSLDKYCATELHKQMLSYALALCGPNGAAVEPAQVLAGLDFQTRFLTSIGAAIAGGTSDIQKNIVAERILGLPRDAR